jgi:hypothetical protein
MLGKSLQMLIHGWLSHKRQITNAAPGNEAARGRDSASNTNPWEVQRPENVSKKSCFCGNTSFKVKYELLQSLVKLGNHFLFQGTALDRQSQQYHRHCTYRSDGSRSVPKGSKLAYMAHYRWGPAFSYSIKECTLLRTSAATHHFSYALGSNGSLIASEDEYTVRPNRRPSCARLTMGLSGSLGSVMTKFFWIRSRVVARSSPFLSSAARSSPNVRGPCPSGVVPCVGTISPLRVNDCGRLIRDAMAAHNA